MLRPSTVLSDLPPVGSKISCSQALTAFWPSPVVTRARASCLMCIVSVQAVFNALAPGIKYRTDYSVGLSALAVPPDQAEVEIIAKLADGLMHRGELGSRRIGLEPFTLGGIAVPGDGVDDVFLHAEAIEDVLEGVSEGMEVLAALVTPHVSRSAQISSRTPRTRP